MGLGALALGALAGGVGIATRAVQRRREQQEQASLLAKQNAAAQSALYQSQSLKAASDASRAAETARLNSMNTLGGGSNASKRRILGYGVLTSNQGVLGTQNTGYTKLLS